MLTRNFRLALCALMVISSGLMTNAWSAPVSPVHVRMYADSTYVAKWGRSEAISRMQSAFNTVSSVYSKNFGVQMQVELIDVDTFAASDLFIDPHPMGTGAEIRLTHKMAENLPGTGADGKGWHTNWLFVHKPVGGHLGAAYPDGQIHHNAHLFVSDLLLGEPERTFVGSPPDFAPTVIPATPDTVLTSAELANLVLHELGHLFGGTHPPAEACNHDRTIMCYIEPGWPVRRVFDPANFGYMYTFIHL